MIQYVAGCSQLCALEFVLSLQGTLRSRARRARLLSRSTFRLIIAVLKHYESQPC
jgi:hypothetical protein